MDAEAVLGVGVGAQLLGDLDPLPGWPSASADDYEGVAFLLEFPEDLGVPLVRLRGALPGEEAPAEADGDLHGSDGICP